MTEAQRQHRWMVILAFGLVYLFWGSTYLGIRIGVEQIPPALMCGTRFTIAGLLMLLYCALSGRTVRYPVLQLSQMAVIGLLLLMGGNLTLSFAEQLLHAAGANYFFINIANGEKPPAQEDPSRAKYKTKADVVAFVKKSFDDGAATIKAKGDAGMAGMMVDPFENQQVRVFDWAYGFMEHSGEHYGPLVVYYRLAGLVPPESRPKK